MEPAAWWAYLRLEFERRLDRDQGGAGDRCWMHVVIKPSEMSAMQTEVLMDAFHEAGLPHGVINVVTGLGEVVGRS